MKSLQTGGFFKRHFDELLALFMVIGLLAVLLLLGIRMGALQEQSRKLVGEVDGMKPAYLRAKVIDVNTYEEVRRQIGTPIQISVAWSNQLFVPETRVWCVDCRRPIPFVADLCPFCKAQQPIPSKQDMDGDGMPDEWEERSKLDPRDPADAALDPDGDGFSNLEEFLYNPSTDPHDKDSTPPIVSKLFVDRVEAEPFMLLFKSLIKQPDGSYAFGLNTRSRDTPFVKLGQTVEGFKLEKFALKLVEDNSKGVRIRERNKSILTLSHGGKRINLVYDEAVPVSDYIAHLVFTPDGSTYAVKKGGEFLLKDKKYVVLEIDISSGVVVLERELDGKRLNIGKPTVRPEARASSE